MFISNSYISHSIPNRDISFFQMLTATLKKKSVQVLFKGKRWVIFKKYDSIFWKSLCLEAQQLWLPDCVAAQVSQGLYSFVVKYTIKLDFKYTIKLEMEEGGNPYCVASSSSLPSPAPSPSNKKVFRSISQMTTLNIGLSVMVPSETNMTKVHLPEDQFQETLCFREAVKHMTITEEIHIRFSNFSMLRF